MAQQKLTTTLHNTHMHNMIYLWSDSSDKKVGDLFAQHLLGSLSNPALVFRWGHEAWIYSSNRRTARSRHDDSVRNPT